MLSQESKSNAVESTALYRVKRPNMRAFSYAFSILSSLSQKATLDVHANAMRFQKKCFNLSFVHFC